MKKILLITGLLFSLQSISQNYTPIQLSGFNADVIAEDTGTINSKTSSSVAFTSYNYFSNNWQLNTNSNPLAGGLPENRIINSNITPNLFFQLENYSQNNCLQYNGTDYEYTIDLVTPIRASKLYILLNADEYFYLNPTIHFTDGSIQELEEFYVGPQNELRNNNVCFSNFSFINRDSNEVIGNSNPSFSQIEIPILHENQNKLIENIEISQWSWSGKINYFAASIQEPSNCIAPTIANTSSGTDSVDINISTNSNSFENFYYEIRTNERPGINDNGLVTSGFINTTNINIGGLLPGTEYIIYLKQICNSLEESEFSRPYRFVTSCGIVNYLNENFNGYDPYSYLDTPHCWSLINTNSYSSYTYFYNLGYENSIGYILENYDANPNDKFILVSPQTNNLGNGNYRIKFKANSSSESELNIVSLNSNDSNATITTIETVTLDNEFREYTINLPTTTDDYFGFQHPLSDDFVYIAIDDVIYEPIPTCPDIIEIQSTTDYSNMSVEFSWNSLGDNFELEYGPRNFNRGSGTLIQNITSSPYTTTLQNTGAYDFYIRRICDENDSTQWFGPYRFVLDYCIPDFLYSYQALNNFTINNQTYTPNSEINQYITNPFIMYNNYTNDVSFNSQDSNNIKFWIDKNNNGEYEENEEVLINNETGVNIDLDLDPINLSEGLYNARIISTDYYIPSSCYIDWVGNSYNLIIKIETFCNTYDSLDFENISQNQVDIVLEDTYSTNSLEYGITGFNQGSGTFINSILSGGTVSNLSANTTYDFYIKMNCDDSDWAGPFTVTTLCDVPAPTGQRNQILANDSTINDIVVSGENIKIYNSLPLTNSLPLNTPVSQGLYYITQTIDCESLEYLTVNLSTVERIAKPIVSNPVRVCESTILSEIPVTTLSNTTIKWYDNINSTTPIPENTVVNSNSTYYVTQSNIYTESHKQEVNIQISNNIPNQLTTTSIVVCRNILFRDLILNENYNGELKWYLNENDINPINPNAIVNSGVYYVTQKVDVCESIKQEVLIENNRNTNPVTTSLVDICGAGIISDVQIQTVNGAELKWYSSLTSSTPLSDNTNLTTSTYYVEQIINGCASERKPIVVRVNSKVAPAINNIEVCDNTKFQDLNLPVQSGTEYVFFNTPTSTNEINGENLITTGTYYVARKTNNCISDKKAINITVVPVPNSPTGNSLQEFVGDPTINDLVMNQSNIVWYSSYQDAISGNNPLSVNMPLTDGFKYYAVIANGNCRSLPKEVTVIITLKNHLFDIEELKIYPNPFFDIVNIEFNRDIEKVEIFSVDGKIIHKQIINGNNHQFNLSHLNSGTYILNIHIDNNVESVKIIKR